MLKVGLVGVGGISGAHIPAWQRMEDVELVALCDVRPERMDGWKEQVSFRAYTDLETMLANETLDILDICLPTYLHPWAAEMAMKRGIHVVTEKPISLIDEDPKRLYAIAKENHVCFMVAQVLRFWDEYVFLKNTIEQGTYGKVLSGTMHRLGSYPSWSWDDWMRDPARSGMTPFDLHIHDLDYLVYAFGAPKKAEHLRCRNEVQDLINVTYWFDGFWVTAQAAWYPSPKYAFSAGYRFQLERATVEYKDGVLTVYPVEGDPFQPMAANAGNDEDAIFLPQTDGYYNELRYFTDCVEQGGFPDKVKPDELTTVLKLLHDLDR